jgi:hypothetical protein
MLRRRGSLGESADGAQKNSVQQRKGMRCKKRLQTYMFVFESEKEYLFHDCQPRHSSTIATVLLDLIEVTGITCNFASALKS